MKIAIVISGLVRFPEQGFHRLKQLIQNSTHDIDVFAGIWDSDSVPSNISQELKRIAVIPCSLKDELHQIIKKHNVLVNEDVRYFIESHSGLISHMAACTEFSNELLHYDAVIKWRWDVAVTHEHFERFCKRHGQSKNTLTTDNLFVDHGHLYMNEVLFIADPELMIKSFTPVRERFLALAVMLDAEVAIHGKKFIISTFNSHSKLVTSVFGSIITSVFQWALLRKNILDNLHLLDTQYIHDLVVLQQEWDMKITEEKIAKQKEQDLQSINK